VNTEIHSVCVPSASSLPRSYLNVVSPALSMRRLVQARDAAWALMATGSAAATTAKSTLRG
jgi:hypothetical protein